MTGNHDVYTGWGRRQKAKRVLIAEIGSEFRLWHQMISKRSAAIFQDNISTAQHQQLSPRWPSGEAGKGEWYRNS